MCCPKDGTDGNFSGQIIWSSCLAIRRQYDLAVSPSAPIARLFADRNAQSGGEQIDDLLGAKGKQLTVGGPGPPLSRGRYLLRFIGREY
jgi:hypothetical protein